MARRGRKRKLGRRCAGGALARARIDFNERFSLLHQIPLFEKDLHQLPVNPALDRNRIDRSNGSEAGYIDSNISCNSLGCSLEFDAARLCDDQ